MCSSAYLDCDRPGSQSYLPRNWKGSICVRFGLDRILGPRVLTQRGKIFALLRPALASSGESQKNLIRRYLVLVSCGSLICLFTYSCPWLFPPSCPAPLLVWCSMLVHCLRPRAYSCRPSCLIYPHAFEEDLGCFSWTALPLHVLILAGADPTAALRSLILRRSGPCKGGRLRKARFALPIAVPNSARYGPTVRQAAPE